MDAERCTTSAAQGSVISVQHPPAEENGVGPTEVASGEVAMQHFWTCATCTVENAKEGKKICDDCGAHKNLSVDDPDAWECEECSFKNNPCDRMICLMCNKGKKRKADKNCKASPKAKKPCQTASKAVEAEGSSSSSSSQLDGPGSSSGRSSSSISSSNASEKKAKRATGTVVDEARLMEANTDEAREHFKKLGFIYLPDVFSREAIDKIDGIFPAVFDGNGRTRTLHASPFQGKGYWEGMLQSAPFGKATKGDVRPGAAWVRVGSDKDKNSVPENTQCWHQGNLSTPLPLEPRPELAEVYAKIMELIGSASGKTLLDDHVPDKDTLYLVQVIKYLRSERDSSKRGSHQDDIQNAAHVIIGYTGGVNARYLTMREGGFTFTYKLTPGSIYIMKDESRYGDKMALPESNAGKCYHEPISLIGHECLALVFRMGTPPQAHLSKRTI